MWLHIGTCLEFCKNVSRANVFSNTPMVTSKTLLFKCAKAALDLILGLIAQLDTPSYSKNPPYKDTIEIHPYTNGRVPSFPAALIFLRHALIHVVFFPAPYLPYLTCSPSSYPHLFTFPAPTPFSFYLSVRFELLVYYFCLCALQPAGPAFLSLSLSLLFPCSPPTWSINTCYRPAGSRPKG